MKRHGVWIMGACCLLASVVWMLLAKASTGGFLLLASVGGALVTWGVGRAARPRK